jgi:hypothetical protein
MYVKWVWLGIIKMEKHRVSQGFGTIVIRRLSLSPFTRCRALFASIQSQWT